MTDFKNAMAVSVSAMQAQAMRMRHVTENIANADTPGYRRKVSSFDQVLQMGQPTGLVQSGPVRLDRTDLRTIHDPSHPMADANGNYKGSNVDIVLEIADAREAQRSYEANLKMFDQARQMSKSLLELLRR